MKKIILFNILFIAIFTFSFEKTFAFNYFDFFSKYTNNINANFSGLSNTIQKINFGNLFSNNSVTKNSNNFSNTTVDQNYSSTQKNSLIYSDTQTNEGNGTLSKLSKLISGINNSNTNTTNTNTGISNSNISEATFHGDPKSSTYATPTPAQVEEYFQQTGKEYVSPNSSSFSQPLSANSPETSAQKYYQQNPGQVGQNNNNPSVWNGDPKTAPFDNGRDNNPINMNAGNFPGKVDADEDSKRSLNDGRFTEMSEDGWLATNATNFGLNTNGSPDIGLVNAASGCPTSMSSYSASGPIRVCNTHVCVVSLPPDVMDYYWGKTNWGASRIGKWTTSGPLPYKNSIGSLYKNIAGTPIEVVNKENGRCTVAPLWETGPAKSECQRGKCGLDLTYCVKVTLLGTKSGLTPVRYRPVPQGKKGCEGYNYIPAPVNSPINKTGGS